MLKLSSKRFRKSLSRLGSIKNRNPSSPKGSEKDPSSPGGEVKWEVRPGGMIVQKRDDVASDHEEIITVRVSTVSTWHNISIDVTSTFGELKMILTIITGLETIEQRILYKGKEREDNEYLHMVGIKDNDKVLLLQDPAIKDIKLRRMAAAGGGVADIGAAFRTITV